MLNHAKPLCLLPPPPATDTQNYTVHSHFPLQFSWVMIWRVSSFWNKCLNFQNRKQLCMNTNHVILMLTKREPVAKSQSLWHILQQCLHLGSKLEHVLLFHCTCVVVHFYLPFWTVFISLQWKQNRYLIFIVQKSKWFLSLRGSLHK
jgi:hypothetical protein